MLKDQVTGSLAKQASGFLGEDESTVTSALGSAFPAILGGMIEKGADEKGAKGLMDMMENLDSNMIGNIGNIFGGGASSVNGLLNSGGGILDSILGNKLGGVASIISKVSGLGSGSSSSLLKMAAPLLMGLVGKQVSGKGPSALMDLLVSQKDSVASAMPSGMGSILGIANLGDSIKNVTTSATETIGNAANVTAGVVKDVSNTTAKTVANTADAAGEVAKSGLGWLKAVLPLLLIAAVAWWLFTQGGADKMKDVAGDAIETTTDAAGAVTGAAGDAVDAVSDVAGAAFSKVNEAAKSALDKISFATGSAGAQMIKFIEDGFKGSDSFRFNNVNFATGSAQLTPDSVQEIDNLAAILKAYEGVNIEIQGYTDNQGDAAKNVTLSQGRAASVQARLLAQGIDNSRMKAVGYGAENPVADNSTEDGRAQNRRIEIKLAH